MMPKRSRCLVLPVIALASPWIAAAQETAHAGPVYMNAASFPEVQVLVDVPPKPTPESILPGKFTLRVDGGQAAAATGVQTLAKSGFGMAAVAMLDVSGSMTGGPLNAIRAGLARFASQVTPPFRAAVVTVADETRWDTGWDDTPEQVRSALTYLSSRGKLTRLWDGLLLEVIPRFPETPLARRVVVISDGHDEGSQHTLDEVIAAANAAHVTVDSIGMTRSDPRYLANLERLSKSTGGLFRHAASLTKLEELVGDGIERYRALPVATFRAAGITADGQAHKFSVGWLGLGSDMQSEVEAQVPGEAKPAAAPAPVEQPQGAPVSQPAPSATGSNRFSQIPKQWLWIGGGVLGVLVLGLIGFILMRKPKQAAAPLKPQPSAQAPGFAQSPSYAPTFQQPPTLQQQKEFFQQTTTPPAFPPAQTLQQAPLMPPAQPPPGTAPSVYTPLPAEFAPTPVQQPIEPRAQMQAEPRFQMPARNNPTAWLVGIDGPAAGQSYAVDDAQFWIGANPNNHLQLGSDPTVSGNHACIAFEQDSLEIFDHQSTNGVQLNGERLSEARRMLRAGDRIRIGRSTFVLQPASSSNRP